MNEEPLPIDLSQFPNEYINITVSKKFLEKITSLNLCLRIHFVDENGICSGVIESKPLINYKTH